MRATAAYHHQIDRQRLRFATCRRCEKRIAVFALPDQDVGALLLNHGYREMRGTDDELTMQCQSCWELNPVCFTGPGVSLMEFYNQLPKDWCRLVNVELAQEVDRRRDSGKRKKERA